jgi:hypothetical protein
MKRINLRTYYSFIYPHDKYCDVPDEVASLLKELRREEHAYHERQRFNNACTVEVTLIFVCFVKDVKSVAGYARRFT